MAVFTPVSRDDLDNFLSAYELGEVRNFEGIDSGIENSNFFLDTDTGRFVLTLFERLEPGQLPFYLDLMQHLAGAGVPCPNPVARRDGTTLGALNNKPAALVSRLPGVAIMAPDAAHCRAVGTALARMHLAATSFGGTQLNLRGLAWWREVVPTLLPEVPIRARSLLEEEMAVQCTFASSATYSKLPRSAVHADLFRDNILFVHENGQPSVGGIIDFYFAGIDTWIFDLAVTVNDWCIHDRNGSFDTERLIALLSAYRAVRPLNRFEQSAWPFALRAAAMRFWVSRLHDAALPRPAEMITPKDPRQYEQILIARRQDAVTVGQALLAD